MIVIYYFDLLNLRAEGYDKEKQIDKEFIVSIYDNKIEFFDILDNRKLRDFEWIFGNYEDNKTILHGT